MNPNSPLNQPSTTFEHQRVITGTNAQKKMLKGAKLLADAVKSTMGPSGHSVILDTQVGPPIITKDGITVAKSIHLKDRLESLGAEILKEVAGKSNDQAGDGSTTATVLGYTMLEQGIKMTSSGFNSIEVKQGMDHACDAVVGFLKTVSLSVDDQATLEGIATISANGDKELGKLIAEAVSSVGPNGIVTFETSKSIKTTLNMVQGMQIGSGYVSPFFVTNSDKASCEMKNPLVLVTSNKISTVSDIVAALQKASDDERPLLILCENLEAEALHTCVVNKTKGVVQVCAVKAPSYGEHRSDILADVAMVTGAEVIGVTSATSLKNMNVDTQLGSCSKVIVTRNSTTFITDASNEAIKAKTEEVVKDMRSLLDNDKTLDDLRIARYRERLARLSGGVAVVQVGGATEIEIGEKKDRVEDAVNATLAAVQEGVVAGGGTTLFNASLMLAEMITEISGNHNDSFIAGIKVIQSACEAPLRTIVSNTGKSPDVVIEKLQQYYETDSKKFNIVDGMTSTEPSPERRRTGPYSEADLIKDMVSSKTFKEFAKSIEDGRTLPLDKSYNFVTDLTQYIETVSKIDHSQHVEKPQPGSLKEFAKNVPLQNKPTLQDFVEEAKKFPLDFTTAKTFDDSLSQAIRSAHNTLKARKETEQVVIDKMPSVETIRHTMLAAGISEETVNTFIENYKVDEAISRLPTRMMTTGYNALTGTYENLLLSKVIDPVKVTRMAMINATSVIGLVLTCNAVVLHDDGNDSDNNSSS